MPSGLDDGVNADLKLLLDDVQDTILREVLYDVATKNPMRVDLFRRGVAPLTPSMHLTSLLELNLVPLSLPPADVLDELDGNAEYRGAVEQLRMGPARVGDLVATATAQSLPEVITVVRRLLGEGAMHPRSEACTHMALEASTRLNEAVVVTGPGESGAVFAAPEIGSAIRAFPIDIFELVESGTNTNPSDSDLRRALELIGIDSSNRLGSHR